MTSKNMKPPQNREFLGLVDAPTPYWGIFWWATKKDGADRNGYVDRDFFEMPKLLRWQELPPIKEDSKENPNKQDRYQEPTRRHER